MSILEHITNKSLPNKPKKEMVMEEYEKFDKETRALTYKMLMEKFNNKYSGLANNQKSLLKEYVFNVSNNPKLKTFINKEIKSVKTQLSEFDILSDITHYFHYILKCLSEFIDKILFRVYF